ncbi:head-tail joining protein [Roseibium sediminicola]|uniref:Head-tail joining protein n=1 Tax=Roseibium sediminicola TaxID=2933272 RepID=A0ABT0H0G1_9HYPH|nr:hypothetical protein [Roseibium sp. CAU 1639]MCK7615185.1 hypothetical protein [Roseibium sp. CAU 1639]
MLDLDKEVVDAEFEELGVDATYTPAVGDPVDCKILLSSDDDTALEFGGRSRPIGRNTVLRVRASEVSPANGQTFTLTNGGQVYRIAAEPALEDTARLVWRFKAVAV